jgi:hypothetical protein
MQFQKHAHWSLTKLQLNIRSRPILKRNLSYRMLMIYCCTSNSLALFHVIKLMKLTARPSRTQIFIHTVTMFYRLLHLATLCILLFCNIFYNDIITTKLFGILRNFFHSPFDCSVVIVLFNLFQWKKTGRARFSASVTANTWWSCHLNRQCLPTGTNWIANRDLGPNSTIRCCWYKHVFDGYSHL